MIDGEIVTVIHGWPWLAVGSPDGLEHKGLRRLWMVLLFSKEAEFREEEGPGSTVQWKEMEARSV